MRTRDQLSRDQLPRDQLLQYQLFKVDLVCATRLKIRVGVGVEQVLSIGFLPTLYEVFFHDGPLERAIVLRANNTRVTRGYKTGEAACALLFPIDKLMSSLLEGKAFSRSINSWRFGR